MQLCADFAASDATPAMQPRKDPHRVQYPDATVSARNSMGLTGALQRRGPAAHMVRTILPMCRLVSMRAWAAAASTSGKVLSITGATLPAATRGQTLASMARAIAALSAFERERSVEPVWCRRLSI